MDNDSSNLDKLAKELIKTLNVLRVNADLIARTVRYNVTSLVEQNNGSLSDHQDVVDSVSDLNVNQESAQDTIFDIEKKYSQQASDPNVTPVDINDGVFSIPRSASGTDIQSTVTGQDISKLRTIINNLSQATNSSISEFEKLVPVSSVKPVLDQWEKPVSYAGLKTDFTKTAQEYQTNYQARVSQNVGDTYTAAAKAEYNSRLVATNNNRDSVMIANNAVNSATRSAASVASDGRRDSAMAARASGTTSQSRTSVDIASDNRRDAAQVANNTATQRAASMKSEANRDVAKAANNAVAISNATDKANEAKLNEWIGGDPQRQRDWDNFVKATPEQQAGVAKMVQAESLAKQDAAKAATAANKANTDKVAAIYASGDKEQIANWERFASATPEQQAGVAKMATEASNNRRDSAMAANNAVKMAAAPKPSAAYAPSNPRQADLRASMAAPSIPPRPNTGGGMLRYR